MRFKRGLAGVYWYYALWQRQLARKARALHAEHHFDLAHHVTFASDWLPCGLRFGPKIPLIWGPVGGATHFPRAMARWVGLRGYLSEAFRDLSTGIMRRIWSDPMARRSNRGLPEPRRCLPLEHLALVLVEPNAAFREELVRFVFAARATLGVGGSWVALVGWKGVRLALTCPPILGWPTGRWISTARATNVAGWRPKSRAWAGRSRPAAGAASAPRRSGRLRLGQLLLFPAARFAGWVAGEASSAGCPVVCLDVGGPPLLAGPNAFPSRPTSTPDGLVRAVLAASEHEGVAYHRWQLDRLAPMVDQWYWTRWLGSPTRH